MPLPMRHPTAPRPSFGARFFMSRLNEPNSAYPWVAADGLGDHAEPQLTREKLPNRANKRL